MTAGFALSLAQYIARMSIPRGRQRTDRPLIVLDHMGLKGYQGQHFSSDTRLVVKGYAKDTFGFVKLEENGLWTLQHLWTGRLQNAGVSISPRKGHPKIQGLDEAGGHFRSLPFQALVGHQTFERKLWTTLHINPDEGNFMLSPLKVRGRRKPAWRGHRGCCAPAGAASKESPKCMELDHLQTWAPHKRSRRAKHRPAPRSRLPTL
jgi:hypothetical protein